MPKTPDAIEEALAAWLDNHAHPEETLLIIGRTTLSPRDIVEEVRNRTAIGREIRERIERLGIERVISSPKIDS